MQGNPSLAWGPQDGPGCIKHVKVPQTTPHTTYWSELIFNCLSRTERLIVLCIDVSHIKPACLKMNWTLNEILDINFTWTCNSVGKQICFKLQSMIEKLACCSYLCFTVWVIAPRWFETRILSIFDYNVCIWYVALKILHTAFVLLLFLEKIIWDSGPTNHSGT